MRPAPQGKLNGNRRRVLTLEIAISANRRLARVAGSATYALQARTDRRKTAKVR